MIQDLDSSNHGCLVGNERLGIWLRFRIADVSPLDANLAFLIEPGAMMDLDFALWGPYMDPPGSGPEGSLDWLGPENSCPPAQTPLRCSFAGNVSATGLQYSGTLGTSQGAGGNGFVRHITTRPGEVYLLYIDNWSLSGLQFDLTWTVPTGNYGPMALIDCAFPTIITPPMTSQGDFTYDPIQQHLVIQQSGSAWSILSIGGQLLSNGTLINERTMIPVMGLPPGIYIIHTTGANASLAQLFIKY